jgi:hypothetical protein
VSRPVIVHNVDVVRDEEGEMLRRVPFMILIAGLSAGVSGFAPHDADADRKAIVALEDLWLNAYDAPTLDRILASDFRHPVVTGQFLTKQQHIEWTVAHPPPQARKARFEHMDVRLFNDVAIANGVVLTEGLTPAPMRTIFTDVFVRRDGRWRAINAQENEVLANIDRRGASTRRQ